MIKLFTIGFTRKTAQQFFDSLRSAGVKTVVDTRLNNSGQLAGFSKKDDLRFFADRLLGARYTHWLDAAPTEDLLKKYRNKEITWGDYERAYKTLIEARAVEKSLFAKELDNACLLCTEDKPHHCHRRILAEYLAERIPGGASIAHL